jgi:magnesium-transporting ATPase (P-type)
MLTGDKLETGECVSYSSGLINEGMAIYRLSDIATLNQDIENSLKSAQSEKLQKALITTGKVFSMISANEDIKEQFLKLASCVDVGLGCRFLPK